MNIVEFARFGGPEELQLIEVPTPQPGAGQILIEVKASGINFADVMARSGVYPNVRSAPFRPGFEAAGVVTVVGEGVENFAVGDRAMALLRSAGYATHAILEASQAVKLPDTLDFAPATALLVQGLTAYFLLEEGNVGTGKSVLIPSAAGGVGSLAVQIAKLRGAGPIIGLASPRKHEAVKQLGADAVFDYTQPGWSKQVKEATGGRGIDIFLDSQGDVTGEGVDTLADKAMWMVYGGQAQGGGVLDAERLWDLVFRNITLRGYTVFSNAPDFGRALEEMFGWVASGQLIIEAGHRFPLAKAAEAHEAIENRQTTGKVVLEP
jgi:NADPH2:quinone reductase